MKSHTFILEVSLLVDAHMAVNGVHVLIMDNSRIVKVLLSFILSDQTSSDQLHSVLCRFRARIKFLIEFFSYSESVSGYSLCRFQFAL